MIRLYPQVIKSEENIQDLQRVLGSIEAENREQSGRLAECSQRIHDLGAELSRAKQAHCDRLHEKGSAVDGARGLRDRLKAQLEAANELRGHLTRAQAMHSEQLERLAGCEHESKQRWDVLFEREAELSELSTQLWGQAQEQQELQGRLGAAEGRQEGLLREYDQAEKTSAVFAEELREVGAGASAASRTAEGHEAERAQLGLQASRLGGLGEELQCRLASLECTRPEGEELRQALQGGRQELEELYQKLAHGEPRQRALWRELERCEQRVQALRDSLASEDGEVAESRDRLGEAEARNGRLEAELLASRGESEALRQRLGAAEHEAGRLENELGGRLDRGREQGRELQGRASELEEESRNLRTQLNNAKAQKQELLAAVAEREQEMQDLKSRHQEAERDYQVEKEKCRCVVS